jgi:hypothetical protein
MKNIVLSIVLTLTLSVFAVFEDGDNVIGLWHMDYGDGQILQDDNSVNTNRNTDLYIYGCSSTVGISGEAILLSSPSDYINSLSPGGTYSTPWQGTTMNLTSIKIEAVFRVDQKDGLHWIANFGAWEGPILYTDGSAVKFYYKLNDGSTNTLAVYGVPNANPDPSLNSWITATAIVNPFTGIASLKVEGVPTDPVTGEVTAALSAGQKLNSGNWQLEIGGDGTFGGSPNASRAFVGAIDEFKVSTFDEIGEWSIDYTQPLEDNKYVKMLYHMDEFINSTYIADDDSMNPGRDAEVQTLLCNIVPGMDGLDNALDFNGSNSVAIAGGVSGSDWWNFPWKAYPSVKIEGWFNIETKPGDHWLVQVGNWVATVYTSNTAVKFSYKMNDGSIQTLQVYAVPNPEAGVQKWVHVVAEFNHFLGKASLQVDAPIATSPASGYVESDVSGMTLAQEFSKVEIGSDNNGTSRQLDGQIDEVRISVPSDSAYDPYGWQTIYDDTKSTQGLWHFDEEVTGAEITTPDDDSYLSRGNDLVLYEGDMIAVNSEGPVFIDNDPNRAAVYLFDGVNDNMKGSNLDFDVSNFRVEAWVKFDGTSSGTYPILWQDGSFLLMIENGSVYWVVAIGDGSAGLKGALFDYSDYDDGKWHHIAGDFFNGMLKIYVDGEFVYANSMSSLGTAVANTGGNIYVGKFVNNDGPHFWDGMIDEVRVSAAYPEYGCGSWGYLPADFNNDCLVGIDDLKLLSQYWLLSNESIDLTKDQFIDYEDYSILSDDWLECSDPEGAGCIIAN